MPSLFQIDEYSYKCKHCGNDVCVPQRVFGRPLDRLLWLEEQLREHDICAKFGSREDAREDFRRRCDIKNAKKRMERASARFGGLLKIVSF